MTHLLAFYANYLRSAHTDLLRDINGVRNTPTILGIGMTSTPMLLPMPPGYNERLMDRPSRTRNTFLR